MELLGGSTKLVEIADDPVALSLGNSDNGCDEARVEENRLPSSDGVSPNQRVLCDDRFPANSTAETIGSITLDLCRLQSFKSLQVLLHTRGQEVVYSVLG